MLSPRIPKKGFVDIRLDLNKTTLPINDGDQGDLPF